MIAVKLSKKAKKVMGVAIVVAAAAGLAGYKYAQRKKPDAKETVVVSRGDLVVKYQEVGELEPKVKVDVKSNVTGRITKLVVEEGDVVEKGQLLAVVQPGQSAAERYRPYEVRAPMGGTIIKRRVEVGDSVVSGLAEFGSGSVLVTIGDLSRMIVKLDVNEVDVPKLSLHMPADIHLDALPADVFKGDITFLSTLAELNDQRVKIFRAKVEISGQNASLKPGMTARVEVVLARKARVLKAPLEAIFEEKGRKVAYLHSGDPKIPAAMRPVGLGLQDEVDAEVLSGLREGDKLDVAKPEVKKDAKS